MINKRMGVPLVIGGYFSPDECRRTIDLASHLKDMEGLAGYNGMATHLRNSRIKAIALTESNAWLFKKIQNAAFSANQQYQFDITGFEEAFQLASYTNGGHFGWHLDIGTEVQVRRKLSISVQLSDGADYAGGDLEFLAVENQRIPRGLGDLIIFPTFLAHRVTPVTSGTRWSLVAWAHGPPFR